MKRRAEAVLLGLLGVAIVGLVALNVLAWRGGLGADEDAGAPSLPAAAGETATAPAATTERGPASSGEDEPAPVETTPATTGGTDAAPAPAAAPRLVLTAARGDCYLLVRRDSAEGELLYEAVLPQGGTVDFAVARLWLRIGASGNLDATLDGRPLELPPGTVDVVVTRAGAEQD